MRIRGRLEYMRTDGCFHDAEVVVNNHTISGHKLVLATYSGYLRNELLASDIVNLDHLDCGAVCKLIDFFYTNCLQLQMSEAKAIMEAVVFLQVDCLRQEVSTFIEDNLTAENCIEWFLVSLELGVSSIGNRARYVMFRQFPSVVLTRAFLELNEGHARAYLCEDDAHRDEALQAAFRWMAHDAPSRRDVVCDLLENLQLRECSPATLKYIIENYEEFIVEKGSMKAMNIALISHIPPLRPM